MRIRRMIVRAVNKIRGVDAFSLYKMRCESHTTLASLALYMNLPYISVADWEIEFSAIPKAQYEKAMKYLRERMEEREWMEEHGNAERWH